KRNQVLSKLRKDRQSMSAVHSDDDQADSVGANEEGTRQDSPSPNKRRHVEDQEDQDGMPSKGNGNDEASTPPPRDTPAEVARGRFKTKAIVTDSDSDAE
ncbi:hypothetical protein GGI22_006057, partial [Coemansia erecta]